MNFLSAMNVLDGDEVRLSYNGIYAQRDIVQVLEFTFAIICEYSLCIALDMIVFELKV